MEGQSTLIATAALSIRSMAIPMLIGMRMVIAGTLTKIHARL